ncbi:MAG: hypothetical protein K8R40_04685 [Anaerolineaceae bacterium]|nr:hypothetical protein [Anaerolineaceae bacterium]
MNNIILPNFESLFINEVYEYYDGPVFLSYFDNNGFPYLALLVDQTKDTGDLVWLYVQQSSERFRFTKTGGMSIKQAYQNAEEGVVYLVTEIVNQESDEVIFNVDVIQASEILEKYLPSDGLRLKFNIPIFQEKKQSLQQLALDLSHQIAEIHLHLNHGKKSFAPIKTLGNVLIESQNLLIQVGDFLDKSSRDAKKITGSVSKALEQALCGHFLQVQHGSVKIQILVGESKDLFGTSLADSALDMLVKLFSKEPDEAIDFLRDNNFSPFIISCYSKFLQTLDNDDITGMDFRWANKYQLTESRFMSRENARSIYHQIDAEEDTESVPLKLTARLVEANIMNGHFEIVQKIDKKEKIYECKSSDSSVLSGAILDRYYIFNLLYTHSTKYSTGELVEKYELIEFHEPGPDDFD